LRGVLSHEYLENEETDNNGLDKKEDRVELVIPLVACDRSGEKTCEIEQATGEVYRP
jgi:hypothetical protein